MNNLKVGDTFEFAMKIFGWHIHKQSQPGIVLKTNVGFGTGPSLPTIDCHTCKSIIGLEFYVGSNNLYHQVLIGNKKLIISIWAEPGIVIGCPERQSR